jgi:hypothetical protein
MGALFMYGVVLFIAIAGTIFVIVEDRKSHKSDSDSK